MEYYDDNDNGSEQDGLEQREPSQDSDPPNSDPFSSHRSRADYQPGSYSKRDRRTQPPRPKNNMALASMICGLTGTLLIFCCFAFPASILLGAAAIALSFMSRKGEPFTGVAVAGLVFGILAVLLGIAECAYLILVNQMLRDPEMARIFEQIMEQYGAKPAQ